MYFANGFIILLKKALLLTKQTITLVSLALVLILSSFPAITEGNDLPTSPVLPIRYFIANYVIKEPHHRELMSKIREQQLKVDFPNEGSGWTVGAAVRVNADSEGVRDDDSDGTTANIFLRHPLPFSYAKNANRARKIQDKAELIALNLEVDALKLEIDRKIRLNYAHYDASYQALEFVRVALSLLNEKRETLSVKIGAGEALRTDMLNVDAEIEEWRFKDQSLRRQLMSSYLLLKDLLGDDSMPLFRPVPLSYSDYASLTLPPIEDLKAKAIAKNSKIQGLISRRDGEWQAAPYWGALPIRSDIYFGPRVTERNDYDVDFTMGVSFGLPLSALSLAKNKKRQHLEVSNQLTEQARIVENELEHELYLWYYRFLENRQEIHFAQTRLRHYKEEERIHGVQTRYPAGKGQQDSKLIHLELQLKTCRLLTEKLLQAQASLAESVFRLQELAQTTLTVSDSLSAIDHEAVLRVQGDELLQSQEKRDQFLDFARLHGIRRVYLELTPKIRQKFLSRKKEKLSDFLFKLHHRQISCELLLDNISLIDPSQWPLLMAAVKEWVQFQIHAPTWGRWDGLHLSSRTRTTSNRDSLSAETHDFENRNDILIKTMENIHHVVKEEQQIILQHYKEEESALADQSLVNSFQSICKIYLDLPTWSIESDSGDQGYLFRLAAFVDGWVYTTVDSKKGGKVADSLVGLQIAALHDKELWINPGLSPTANTLSTKTTDFIANEKERFSGIFGLYPCYRGIVIQQKTSEKELMNPPANQETKNDARI